MTKKVKEKNKENISKVGKNKKKNAVVDEEGEVTPAKQTRKGIQLNIHKILIK